MQVNSNDLLTEIKLNIYKEDNYIKLQAAVTLIALIALSGLIFSGATGNFVAVIVCASILTVTVLVGLIMLGFKTYDYVKNKSELIPDNLETKQIIQNPENENQSKMNDKESVVKGEKNRISNPEFDQMSQTREEQQNILTKTEKKILEEAAAVKFQTIFRRVAAHKKHAFEQLHQFSPVLLERAKPLISLAQSGQLPTAPWGEKKNKIFMPNELPVVIRTHSRIQNRLDSIRSAHKVIADNNLSHIVIPKAQMQGDFLIEERIEPIKGKAVTMMDHYYMNHELFNEAATEFAVFLSECGLGDIIGGDGSWKNNIWKEGRPRYDNVLLLENGKISPIDLDYFSIKPKNNINFELNFLYPCQKAIILFPFQYDLIVAKLEELQSFSFSTKEIAELEQSRDIALKALEEEVGKHYRFLQARYPHQIEQKFEVSPKLYENLRKDMRHTLINLNVPEDFVSDYLGKDPEAALEHFDKVVLPKMLDFLKEMINSEIKSIDMNDLQMHPRLLSDRTVECILVDFYEDFKETNNLNFKVKKEVLKTYSHEERKQYYQNCSLEFRHKSSTILDILIDRLIDAGLIANKFTNGTYTQFCF